MTSPEPTPQRQNLSATAAMFACTILCWSLLDCASPGPPRAPSLGLPEPVRDLAAARVGSSVELHFTVPHQSTDGMPLRGGRVLGTLCRAEGPGPCHSFAGAPALKEFATQAAGGGPNVVTLRDDLDPAIESGAPRLLRYQVEFFNAARRSDGPSASVFALAGAAPAPIANLTATGSRGGVVLSWTAARAGAVGEVLLHRELPGEVPKPEAAARKRTLAVSRQEDSGAVWLQANGGEAATRTLDGSAAIGTTYRYTAQRRQAVQVAGHALELRSELSAPVLFTLPNTFPPAAPANLTAAGFGGSRSYAVDLIWEPVNDPGVVGYLVSRRTEGSAGAPGSQTVPLTQNPVKLPAFSDRTAAPDLRYRYEVVAVDGRGNRSDAAVVTLDPQTSP